MLGSLVTSNNELTEEGVAGRTVLSYERFKLVMVDPLLEKMRSHRPESEKLYFDNNLSTVTCYYLSIRIIVSDSLLDLS